MIKKRNGLKPQTQTTTIGKDALKAMFASEEVRTFNAKTKVLSFGAMGKNDVVKVRLISDTAENLFTANRVGYMPFPATMTTEEYEQSDAPEKLEELKTELDDTYGSYMDYPDEEKKNLNSLKAKKNYLMNVFVVEANDSFYKHNGIDQDDMKSRCAVMKISANAFKIIQEDVEAFADTHTFINFGDNPADFAISFDDDGYSYEFVEGEEIDAFDCVFHNLKKVYEPVNIEKYNEYIAANF